MTDTRISIPSVAGELARLYDAPFGGKPSGRYRISSKYLRHLAGRRRLSESFLHDLGDEMFELGYAFINAETYFVVVGVRTFTNYRRVGAALIGGAEADDD